MSNDITANLIDESLGFADQSVICDYQIDDDTDFAHVVAAAKSFAARSGIRCAIQWTRDSDGQVAYWGPSGACFRPHWFSPEQ